MMYYIQNFVVSMGEVGRVGMGVGMPAHVALKYSIVLQKRRCDCISYHSYILKLRGICNIQKMPGDIKACVEICN